MDFDLQLEQELRLEAVTSLTVTESRHLAERLLLRPMRVRGRLLELRVLGRVLLLLEGAREELRERGVVGRGNGVGLGLTDQLVDQRPELLSELEAVGHELAERTADLDARVLLRLVGLRLLLLCTDETDERQHDDDRALDQHFEGFELSKSLRKPFILVSIGTTISGIKFEAALTSFGRTLRPFTPDLDPSASGAISW